MTESDAKLSRRKVFAGAGAVGALAAVAVAVPMVKADDEPAAPKVASDDRQAGGYQLTEHVKQYYRTARV
ncbi:formate dehydrogenase [Piscinibacter sakaiensis]|uniref:formate dehydrogenase n=1 Tax=Piscinibacter sakaiensis TaxID=1547922 RepID=UPI003AAB765D